MTKTVETYVAPIASKGTHFETIQQHLSCFQALATDVGMSYVNVVHDVGAVMNVLRTIWSYPEEYKNIHLGSFHFSKLFPSKSFCLTGEEYVYISRRIILFLNCILALT